MREAMRALGVSRQTVLQRVKRGELAALHVMRSKQRPAHQSDRPTTRPLRCYLMNQGALCSTFQDALDIRIENVVHLLARDPDDERVQRIVLAAFGRNPYENPRKSSS